MSRTKCSRLLGCAIITAAVTSTLHHTYCSTAAVFAFTPPSSFSARSNSIIQPLKKSTSILTDVCSSSIKLFGYANVNDYFDSFRQDDNNSNDDERLSGSNDSDLKYIGHGRLSASNDVSDIGGAFDVNNYFASFGSQSDNSSSDSSSSLDDDDVLAAQYDEEQSFTAAAANDDSGGNEIPTQESQAPNQKQMTRSQIIAYNNARLDPKSFLTQSSIQSFIYLLEECRDPHSGKWIQDFLNCQNLGNFHGTGAFNVHMYPKWDSVLMDMLRQPNQKMIVSAKRRGRGHGGWSKNNPYLQERWVEFKIDINPASLVQRLLSVREQLALEFERDLEIVGIVDGMIIESYFCTMKREREEQQGQEAAMVPINHQNGRAFERISVNILSNFTEFASSGSTESSPFRKGNFDLLYNLCTQASVHRLLRELRESKVDSVSYQWLLKFYSERLSEFFDGDVAFGRADDFIDALLRSPPSLVSMDDGRSLGLTDPLGIAERIIAKRSEVAHEWIGMMKEVKADHAVFNDLLFRVMMGKAIDATESNEEVIIEEETTFEPLGDDAGAFE